MAITKPPVLPAWAESGDKATPSNADIQVGWPLSSIPPSRQRFNWLLNFLANGIRYFTRRGLPDYDAAETYMTGDRVIGDNGKTYRSLIDNNTAQTPSTSPTKWERWGFTLAEYDAEGTTAAQFDNSTKRASTAFVQRALGNRAGSANYVATGNISASDVGKVLVLSNVSAFTLTLPLLSSVPDGASFLMVNYNAGTATIQRAGADVIAYGGGSLTSISVPNSSSLLLTSNNGSWQISNGDVALNYSPLFGNSKGTSGYFKLPGGIIVQWGQNTFPSGGTVTQANTFPIAFPNACFTVNVGSWENVNNNDGPTQMRSPTTTGFTAYCFNAVAGATGYSYLAIGW